MKIISAWKDRAGSGELFALAAIYLLAVALVFKVKETMLQDGGYRIISRLVGQSEETLGWVDRLQFFSLDILLLLVILPLVLLALSRVMGRGIWARTVLLLSMAIVLLCFVNLNALGTAGKFLSIDQIKPMLDWVRERPSSILEYVTPAAFAKLAVLLTGVIVIYRCRNTRLFSAFKPGPFLLLCAVGVFDVVALYARLVSPVPSTSYNTPVLVQMGAVLIPEAHAAAAQDDIGASGKLGFTCAADAAHAVQPGKPANRNFIFFIMETVPYEIFSQATGKGFGTFDDLQRSGYTAANHYSTYPFTSYARFSIFTGLYPSYRLEKTLAGGTQSPYDSFFSALARDGYDFRVFDPVTVRYEMDDRLIKQMGGKVLSADSGGSVAEKDDLVLDKLIASIGESAESGKPFAYAYLPQLTHGPWLPDGASKAQLYSEGLDRIRQLDKSLAAIVALLKYRNLYENTVIVVTADHGLRTRKEAGFLKTTVLNDVSYHVPLIVHDPAMQRSVAIESISSHLDISPTLHCLYRPGAPAIKTQGKLMTEVGNVPRTLFFGGAWYNGSDGMWDGKGFFSYNRQLAMMWHSDTFDFDESRPLQASVSFDSLVDVFDQHGRTQETLLRN